MKRLFFALWPDEPTRNDLVVNTSEVVSSSSGRPVLPQNLHMTLAFLHNVDEHLLPCVCEAAGRAGGEPFDLTLDHLDFWSRAKILWLGPSDPPSALAELVERLWQELGSCGFTPEKRAFRPHVTLARKAVNPLHEMTVTPIKWSVNSFVLVESITGRRQAEYQVLAEWSLRAS